ncbi:MAG TPA: hypothetical protein VGD72_11275 [Mycobacteriales bacterium]
MTDQSEDYEYDLAHEATPGAPAPHDRHEPPHHAYGGTQTDDGDGDYGYDLAHDVPPQGRR